MQNVPDNRQRTRTLDPKRMFGQFWTKKVLYRVWIFYKTPSKSAFSCYNDQTQAEGYLSFLVKTKRGLYRTNRYRP